jgi:hypothetical protein
LPSTIDQVRPLLWASDDWPLAGEPIVASKSPATQTATLAGRWMFSTDFSEPFAVQLSDDGSTKPDVGRWKASDDVVSFSSSARMQGPRFILSCFLNADRTEFVGRSSEGTIIRGVRG